MLTLKVYKRSKIFVDTGILFLYRAYKTIILATKRQTLEVKCFTCSNIVKYIRRSSKDRVLSQNVIFMKSDMVENRNVILRQNYITFTLSSCIISKGISYLKYETVAAKRCSISSSTWRVDFKNVKIMNGKVVQTVPFTSETYIFVNMNFNLKHLVLFIYSFNLSIQRSFRKLLMTK